MHLRWLSDWLVRAVETGPWGQDYEGWGWWRGLGEEALEDKGGREQWESFL